MGSRPRVAVCFFGITRSLRKTFPSIEANILEPARRLGEVKIYSHFFRQREINIAVSKNYTEQGTVDAEEYRLLESDWLDLEEPDSDAVQAQFDRLRTYGDAWNSDFVLLRNLVHQLHSLQRVTIAAMADAPDVVAFCRPDLLYQDSLLPPLRRAAAARSDLILLPYWQSMAGGYNDRFALCHGSRAISAYGRRIEMAEDFCTSQKRPLHAESLVRYVIERSGIPMQRIGARATRIRVDGRAFPEDFRHPLMRRLQRRIDLLMGRAAT